MTVTIVWWDLTDSDVTIEALEQDMRNSIAAWYEVDGLRAKLWIADRENNRWGAVMWWDPYVPPERPLPPNRAAELIGRPPTHRTQFAVVATAEGITREPRPSSVPTSLSGISMHDYVVVDSFTRRPLDGNPVAVFFDCEDLTTHLMQRIANEMHLSETTFVLPPQCGGDAHIRIFTPVNELPFAGHPMLGTAVALAEKLGQDKLQLETAIGVIPFRLGTDDGATEVWMEQPLPRWELYEHGPELLEALGVETSIAPVEAYRNGPRHVFVGLPDIPALSALHPDHRALARFPDMAVNCFAGAGARWRIRMFSPAYGVVEDAATGSAAGPLAIHLARHGLAGWEQAIEIEQGIELGRPSLMRAVAWGGGEQISAVHVSGHGVVVARGTLCV